jgi:hypothetical protein
MTTRKKPAPSKAKPGKPPVSIDPRLVENSAAIGCTVEEIAAVLGIGRRTLYDRLETDPELAAVLERGRDTGKATLRRLQWQEANKGNATMLIWLGKQTLGQRDTIDHNVTADVEVRTLSDDALDKRIAALLGKIGTAPAPRGKG